MPIFEYRCGECRKTFERIVLGAESEAGTTCPKCGAAAAERLVSRFATSAKSGGDEFGGPDEGGFGGGFGGGGFGGGGIGGGGTEFDEEPAEAGFGGIAGGEEDEYSGPDDDDAEGPETEDGEDDD